MACIVAPTLAPTTVSMRQDITRRTSLRKEQNTPTNEKNVDLSKQVNA